VIQDGELRHGRAGYTGPSSPPIQTNQTNELHICDAFQTTTLEAARRMKLLIPTRIDLYHPASALHATTEH
jgi:hypothetical protein